VADAAAAVMAGAAAAMAAVVVAAAMAAVAEATAVAAAVADVATAAVASGAADKPARFARKALFSQGGVADPASKSAHLREFACWIAMGGTSGPAL
jgi:hypothetical protein